MDIKYKGQTKTEAEWSKIAGLSERAFLGRLERGWSMHRTMTTPVSCQFFQGAKQDMKVTKNELELELNDTKIDSIPESLRRTLKGYNGKKIGTHIRLNDLKAFDRHFYGSFAPAKQALAKKQLTNGKQL